MELTRHSLSRRGFLQASVATVGAAALTGVLPRTLLAQSDPGTFQVVSPNPTPDGQATVLVKDVLDFRLRGDFDWNGGWVQFRMHEGRLEGEPIWFIRTDTSDQSYAAEQGLVFAPLLATARGVEGGTGRIYIFDDGRPAVLSTGPGRDDFTPLYEVVNATVKDAGPLESVAAVELAAATGSISLEETPVVVNYPAVRWPGGELPVDSVVELPLANGPLLVAPDTEAKTVTFKLHQCYPESRYIITDTSAVPMAPMMSIPGSPATAGLAGVGAASTITVFGNGLTGPGAMGFQPGVFREKAGAPAWSPLWDHFTAVWRDPAAATLLTSQAQISELVSAGALELFVGTPDTGGQGFVVNCPAPITAPNDFVVA